MEPLGKHPEMIVRDRQPFNAEPPLNLLRESFVTPKELFYVRNHGSVPEVDPADYRLKVSGLVERPLELSLEEIRNDFPKENVMVALHCAGNRRDELMAVAPTPGETPWNAGAIGNAWWAGVPLREILRAAGATEEARHVAFDGLDEVEEGESPNFGGSIPIKKAMSPDVLLAYEMNDEPLTPEHGSPLRAVVGGYIGARSVKWLSNVRLREAPSDNHFQVYSYKLFPPYVREEGMVAFSKGLALGEISVNAVICSPLEGETLSSGPVPVQGYAIAGGERRIERVDVSADEGRTWVGADLSEEGGSHPWAWRFWETELQFGPDEHRIVVRALDSAADTQPEDVGSIWNFKGYVNNAWHRVRVIAR